MLCADRRNREDDHRDCRGDLVLYDHANCAEEDKKLKLKTEDFVGAFEAQAKPSHASN